MVGTVALALPGPIGGVGGAAMRWRALRDAMAPRGCTVHEIACDRRGRCRKYCLARAIVRDGGEEMVWHHNRKFCRHYADDLVLQFAADGVSTVVCSGLETFEYVRHWASSGAMTVVYDMHNVEAELYRAIGAVAPVGSLHARLFRDEHVAMVAAAEEAAIVSATQVWCCTPQDRRLIADVYPGVAFDKIRVVPNVVPVPEDAPDLDRDPEHVYFIGRLDHYPNIVAARILACEIAPRLAEMGSALPVVVAGAGLTTALDPAEVADNVRLVADPLHTARLVDGGVLVVPLDIGGGSRLKILEAFAAGAPVVSTEKGVEGIDVRPGVHYLAAETAQDFAAAIVEIARTPDLRRRLVTAAWHLVLRDYSIESLTRRLSGYRPAPSARMSQTDHWRIDHAR